MKSLVWIVLTAVALQGQAAKSTASELDGVIRSATEYVTQYEAELGNLIGTEDYHQTAISGPGVGWPSGGTSTLCQASRMPGVVCPGSNGDPVMKPVIRRTSSDFMLFQVGSYWNAVRNVRDVDGKKVNSEQPIFDSAFADTVLDSTFGDTPANNAKRLEAMKAESTKYNIGDILREVNLPTFALQVLHKDQVTRFVFEHAGNEKLNGVQTWRVKFRETSGKALVVNDKGGENLYSSGTLWIEPGSGRVLKTEFSVDNRVVKPSIASTVIVTYTEEKKLQILVPQTMVEHYERIGDVIDCQADYSNFHRFQVQTHFDFGAPPSTKPSPVGGAL